MPPPSSTFVAIKSVDVAAVRAATDAWAARLLAERADIEEVVVFGSFQSGSWAPGSDLDVLMVLSDSPHAPRDRVPALLPGAFPVPVDLFPFTRAELLERRDSPIVVAAAASRWRYSRADATGSQNPLKV